MTYLVIIFFEIAILFLLSRSMGKVLSRFMSINLISLLFLPGVIIHELSHLLTAEIMFVPVGAIEFMPKIIKGGVRLGSVEIGKTDPIRRCIIGFAPVFIGLVLIVGIIYFFSSNVLIFQDKIYVAAEVLGILYLLFAISNTMFSSSRDMEGAVEILITLLVLFILAYILGFRLSFAFLPSVIVKQLILVIQESVIFLLVPISIDLAILGIVKLLRR